MDKMLNGVAHHRDGSGSRAGASSGGGSQPGDAATAGGVSSGGDAQQSITPEQEFFLYELETSDSGSIGLVLRAIYDGGDVEKFLRALEKKIRHYDKDIAKLCSYHYQGFIDAIRELLRLHTQCKALKDDIECIDNHLQESSTTLLSKTEEIVRYRKLQRNIATAIDQISLCLPMLEKYAKLQEQMEQKRWYPALKTLEQLEHTYLPQVSQYRFTQKLMENVADIRDKIKESSFSEFTDFLENIRKISAKIGEMALRHAAEQHDLDSAASQKRRQRTALWPSAADSDVDSPAPKQTTAAPSINPNEDFSAQDMIDFSPVYRCTHIFSVLDAKDAFDSHYRKQRKEQAAVILRAPEKVHGTLEAYLGYFHEVIGFFIVEDHIMQTTPGLVTRQYRDELWELALQQVTKILNAQFGNCLDPVVMLKIKKLILVFALTMKGYGFQVTSFYKLLQNFRDQYNEILMTECCANFDRILRDDHYASIVVADEASFKKINERFPFYPKEQKSSKSGGNRYPRTLAFSEMVPSISEQLRAYVRGCLRFMERLGLSQSDVDDTVRRYCNVLLARLCGSLRSFVTQRQLSLVQLVQITINMGYLEKSSELLENFIAKLTSELTGMHGGQQALMSSGHLVRLKEDVFRDVRSEVEQKIDEALRMKIDEFLELCNYDWDAASGSAGKASDFVSDLIAFLHSTFAAFTDLPPVLARHMCMQACKYVADRLLGFLLDPNVKYISPGALEQFNLDVMQCELFTAVCPVAGLEDGTLGMTFAQLRQLIDLVMSSDWSAYLADYGRSNSKYARVQPNAAFTLLERAIEHEKRTNSLFGNKDRRKLLDSILKKLQDKVFNNLS